MSWNCAGAFHRKLDHLLALEPDIAVIPESCQPERLPLPAGSTYDWAGRLPYKGLAVIGFEGWKVHRLLPYEPLTRVDLTGHGDGRTEVHSVGGVGHESPWPTSTGRGVACTTTTRRRRRVPGSTRMRFPW